VHLAAFYNPGPNGGIIRTGRAPDVTAPTARYPFELALHQAGIESIFLDSMKNLGVEVERSTVPTKIELSSDEALLNDPQSYPVRVTLDHLETTEGPTTEVVKAKYVLGADGAHSWVRRTFDISMDGEQSDFIWGVLDMVPDTDFPDIRNKALIHSNNGSCLLVPREEDRIRIYMQLSDKQMLNPETGRVDKDRMGPPQLLEVAQKSLHPFKLEPLNEINWWTLYIIGQRVASKYSINNRVFIAGDACHTHSPKAGQGMNASMNDAHNLAWKLAFVLRGWSGMELLSTYESERRKYAQDLIAFDKQFSTMFSGKPKTEQDLDGVSHEEFIGAFQTFGGFTSGIGVHYSPSVAVKNTHQALASKLVIGERVPPQVFIRAADAWPFELQDLLPSDFKFKLLVFTGDHNVPAQQARVRAFAEGLEKPGSFYTRYAPPSTGGKGAAVQKRFEVITIWDGKKEEVSYLDIPAVLRPHWTNVLIDDVDCTGKMGGNGYDYFGISPEGAVVVVRPDGYVGTIAPLDAIDEIEGYFAAFMQASV